jgi:hypothetical protein
MSGKVEIKTKRNKTKDCAIVGSNCYDITTCTEMSSIKSSAFHDTSSILTTAGSRNCHTASVRKLAIRRNEAARTPQRGNGAWRAHNLPLRQYFVKCKITRWRPCEGFIRSVLWWKRTTVSAETSDKQYTGNVVWNQIQTWRRREIVWLHETYLTHAQSVNSSPNLGEATRTWQQLRRATGWCDGLQAGATGYTLVQRATRWCDGLQAGATGYRLVRRATGWCKRNAGFISSTAKALLSIYYTTFTLHKLPYNAAPTYLCMATVPAGYRSSLPVGSLKIRILYKLKWNPLPEPTKAPTHSLTSLTASYST